MTTIWSSLITERLARSGDLIATRAFSMQAEQFRHRRMQMFSNDCFIHCCRASAWAQSSKRTGIEPAQRSAVIQLTPSALVGTLPERKMGPFPWVDVDLVDLEQPLLAAHF